MRSTTFAIVVVAFLLLIAYPWLIVRVGASPPTTNNLNGLVLLSPSNGWAVGSGGTIIHFDGVAWRLVPSGTASDLFGLSFGPPNMPNTNDGFAVGGSGGSATALFWSGVSWSLATSGLSAPSAQRLASVFMVTPNDAWTVDSISGAFWHWSGTVGLGGGWNYISSAVSGLNSIFMVTANEGWAVGVGGIIYHYTSGGWALFATVGTTLNSVFMVDSNEGWAVGNAGAIFRYTSGSWIGPVSPGTTNQDLRSVFMVNQAEGWTVGAGSAVLHFSGGVWTALPPNLLATNQNLNAVYFSGNTGWAVGDVGTIVVLGEQPSQGVPAVDLRSVYLTSSSDGWLVGCSTGGCGTGSGEPSVVHWNGVSFTRGSVLGQISDLYSVFMVSPSDGWAVGGVGSTPMILHFTGGTWTQVPTPVSGVILRSVFMVDSSNGWVVGDMGTILRYSGGSWNAVSSPTANALRSVFMLGASDGWAVGDAGTILRYDGTSGLWVRLTSPTGASLNSVFLTDLNHGWTVGAGGTILHYDGTLWLSVAAFVSTDLNSVVQVNPQEAWTVGDSGTILQWTGISWYPVTPSPSPVGNPDLYSVDLVSSGFGLIVGAPPSGGSQATILLVGQEVRPIPEFDWVEPSLAVVFLTTIITITHVRRRQRRECG